MTNDQVSSRKIMGWILAALVVWAVLHAIGAYFFNHNLWRSFVVVASFALFIGMWLSAILLRERRNARR